MKKILLTLGAFGFCLILMGQTSNDQVAKEYMEAYGRWDFEKMSTLYHDSVKFHDPTAAASFPNGTYKHFGKSGVKSFFASIFNNSQPEFISVTHNSSFRSQNFYIYHTTWQCKLPAAWFGEGVTESVLVAIPLDTILEIKDGQVIGHTDYGDYTTYASQIKAQMSQEN